jgi:signal transduction histidine kinase
MRWRLVGMVMAGSLATLLAFALPLAIVAKLLVERRIFGEAELRTRVVAAVLDEVADPELASDALERVDDVDGGPPFSVLFTDGRTLGPPIDAETATIARRAVAEDWDGDGDDDARVEHHDVVLIIEGFRTRGESGASGVVVVAVPDRLLTSDLDRWWYAIGTTAFTLFVVSAALANRLGISIVRPLSELVTATDQLRRGELGTRVDPSGPPEVRALGFAFNLLGERIGQLVTLDAERVSDLSHRLRTPVTALHLDAESLHDPDESARMGARVQRMERAIDEVIADARRRATPPDAGPTPLRDVVAERVEFWRPLFDDQRRVLRFVDHHVDREIGLDSALVAIGRADLAAVVDELLANAVTHTTQSTPVRVGLECLGDGQLVVEVADAGAGFGTGDVLARGVSGTGSSGLGLDIVRRTVEAHGGWIDLGRSIEGGASVRFGFPVIAGSVP